MGGRKTGRTRVSGLCRRMDGRTGTSRWEPSPTAHHQALGPKRPLPTPPHTTDHQQPSSYSGQAVPSREDEKKSPRLGVPMTDTWSHWALPGECVQGRHRASGPAWAWVAEERPRCPSQPGKGEVQCPRSCSPRFSTTQADGSQ